MNQSDLNPKEQRMYREILETFGLSNLKSHEFIRVLGVLINTVKKSYVGGVK